jgi:hypothetical protein
MKHFFSPQNIAISSLFVLFALSLAVSWQESTTMDEQAHIGAGYSYVRYLDMRLNPEHPPLLKDLAGLPLLFLDVNFPTDDPAWISGNNEQWLLGSRFLHENDAHLITFLSRIPILLVAILLGFFLYRWTKQLAGAWAAAGAVVLYSFNPNIIAHSHYVTTDIGIAAAVFITLYFGVRWLQSPTMRNILLFGIILGIAQLVKFSAVLLYPLFALISLVYAISITSFSDTFLQTLGKFGRILGKYWGTLFLAGVISLIPIGILYAINTWNMPSDRLLDLIHLQLTDNGLPGRAQSFLLWLIGIPVFSVLTEYFLGLAMVFVRVTGGNTYYFLGEVFTEAQTWYFPIVYLLKESLGVLILLSSSTLLAIGSFVKNILQITRTSNSALRYWQYITSGIQHRIAFFAMGCFVILYIFLSITGNLNIGIRHLFPIFPFLYVFAAVGAVALWNISKKNTLRGMLTRSGILTLFVWVIITPFIHYPSYLSYYNELVGGPENGYRYVTDSNYDWGQDLKNLKVWVDTYNHCATNRHTLSEDCMSSELLTLLPTQTLTSPIDRIRVDYFGGSSPRYWLGERFVPWTATDNPEPGWYAISATFLQESIHKNKQPNEKSYEWLTHFQPVGRAGDSIFLYYIPKEAERL